MLLALTQSLSLHANIRMFRSMRESFGPTASCPCLRALSPLHRYSLDVHVEAADPSNLRKLFLITHATRVLQNCLPVFVQAVLASLVHNRLLRCDSETVLFVRALTPQKRSCDRHRMLIWRCESCSLDALLLVPTSRQPRKKPHCSSPPPEGMLAL